MALALYLLCVLALSTNALRTLDRDEHFSEECTLNADTGLSAGLLEKADACANGIKIIGAASKFGEEIDDFLIPRAHWRVAYTSLNNVRLRPVPPQLVPLFEDVDRVQFAPRTHACDGIISVTGQWLGAATKADLANGFKEWCKTSQSKPFVPIWVTSNKPAEQFTQYTEPFCDSNSSPTHLQDCFFLPMSNCVMGAEQWERIRNQTRQFGAPQDVTISGTRKQYTVSALGGAGVDILWQMLFFRQNARTRGEVARREHAWRASNPSWPPGYGHSLVRHWHTGTCAALHIRHGDKLQPFWIKQHNTIKGGFNRTLDDYLDEALNLLHKRGVDGAKARVMVMSDDADIIEASIQSKRAALFHVNQSIKSLSDVLQNHSDIHDGDGFHYGTVGSDDMLQWLLTTSLMSACDIFIGNLGSSFSRFIYHALCDQRLGNCPELVNLGCGSPNPSEADVFNMSISPLSIVHPADC